MLQQTELTKLDDYFLPLSGRSRKGIYFYRLNGYNEGVRQFIVKYYEAARKNGVIIEGKIGNPTPQNLQYYNEILGDAFQLNPSFIENALKKWLPRMNQTQRSNVTKSIISILSDLRSTGKNDNMLKNAYMKFMCWLYYKFERIVNALGNDNLPKILYEGQVSNYELLLLSVLSQAGCDIILLQYKGDAEYLKVDAASKWSKNYATQDLGPFPADFSLKKIQDDIQAAIRQEKLYGPRAKYMRCTNAWATGKFIDDVRKSPTRRGSDEKFFYNCFTVVHGVEDRLTYQNELHQLYCDLKNEGRKVLVINESIPAATGDEIKEVSHKNYDTEERLIADLLKNFFFVKTEELHKEVVRAFVDTVHSELTKQAGNLNRLTGKAVTMICWLKRYYQQLFSGIKDREVACCFIFGGCKSENEALFLRFLAMLPVDVIVLQPNLNSPNCLVDALLYEVHYQESLNISQFPEEDGTLRVGTSAYHAEQDLDTLMYQDSGLYRNQQYDKANVVLLQTMYEEIAILWKQEVKYRPNFSTSGDVVNIPVIFAKVSGVKDGAASAYWSSIKQLITEDTVVIKSVPNLTTGSPNPIKPFTTEFFRQGKLQRKKIKAHKAYQYGFLRSSAQDYILDKLQALIEQRTIRGTFENGTEYTIGAVALNLDKNILRLIQKFDFTKGNPKLIYIITSEAMLSLEDTIQVAFLNQIGFDSLFIVPTGYQCVENYFAKNLFEEHQIGEYKYDLSVPDFNSISNGVKTSWFNQLFGRGG